MALSSISAARMACRSAAWAPLSVRCRNMSGWSRAGARRTREIRFIVKLTPNISDIIEIAKIAKPTIEISDKVRLNLEKFV